MKLTFTLSLVASGIAGALGHGYLLSPVSRNFYAKTNGLYFCNNSQQDCDAVPVVENCPHCMNRADGNAQCGVKQDDPSRNYDFPKNYNGGDLPWMTQEYYQVSGQEIDVEFILTAHHKGHVEMYACPVDVMSPTEDCFDQYPLEFVWDYKYGAVKDSSHPERVYVAPTTIAGGLDQLDGGNHYQVRMKLPDGVTGKTLLQWRYYTSNSCLYDGYRSYEWPAAWGGAAPNLSNLGDCPYPLPGFDAAPERFWNCAEIQVGDEVSVPTSPAPMSSTLVPVASPTSAPVAVTDSPVAAQTNAPVGTPTNAPVANAPTDSPVSPPVSVPTASPPSPSSECCSGGVSGLKAVNGCAGYVSCVDGLNHGFISCPAGLLFNEDAGVCDWPYNVVTCEDHCLVGGRRGLLRGGEP